MKRDHKTGPAWPAPLAELGYLRWRKRQTTAGPKFDPARAPEGILRAARAAALWAIALVIAAASAASFAESYRGLYVWAHNHGLSGFWAAAFPLQVDSFIGVGELVLFVATVDRWTWRQRAGAWAVALLGLAVSIAGNIGHVAAYDAQSRGTAAVPPVAAFAALWLGLTVLKRVLGRPADIMRDDAENTPLAVLPEPAESLPGAPPELVPASVPVDSESAALLALRATIAAGNPYSNNQLMTRFGLTRAQAARVRELAIPDQPDNDTAVAAAA